MYINVSWCICSCSRMVNGASSSIGPCSNASSMMLSARAAYAWRHDTSLDAYDRIVGVHVLGETYPGLNSFGDQRTATLPPPALVDGRAHVLVGLNRRGGLDVTIEVTGPATVTWNGSEVAPKFHTDDLRRGTNDLVIEAGSVGPIQLQATD